MKYADQEERERRERAEFVAAASHEIGIFLYGAATAILIVGFVMVAVAAGELEPGVFVVYLGVFLAGLGGAVQFLGPLTFRR